MNINICDLPDDVIKIIMLIKQRIIGKIMCLTCKRMAKVWFSVQTKINFISFALPAFGWLRLDKIKTIVLYEIPSYSGPISNFNVLLDRLQTQIVMIDILELNKEIYVICSTVYSIITYLDRPNKKIIINFTDRNKYIGSINHVLDEVIHNKLFYTKSIIKVRIHNSLIPQLITYMSYWPGFNGDVIMDLYDWIINEGMSIAMYEGKSIEFYE